MQMKHLLVALLVLLALAGTAVAADSVEIRSEVLDFNALPATISTITLDETSWAGFYYNIDDNVATESMKMMNDSGKLTILYETHPEFQAYDYNFGTNLGYAVIGFFAEPYVALGKVDTQLTDITAAKANKIAKLVLDTDERYILKTGATLELGDGYSLVVDQIDVDGNKAYIKFLKDGQEINSSIITTGTGTALDGQWTYTIKVLGESDRQVMRMHVKSVFQGTESSLVEIEGLWLVDYLNAIEVKSDTDYGKWEADSIGTASLSYKVDAISVNNDEDLDLGKGIFLKTGTNYSNSGHPMEGMFYLYKVYTDAGTYNIRSTVYDLTVSGAGGLPATYTYLNFAAFYFDINTGIETENLSITANGTNKYDIEYNTTPKQVDYDFTGTASTPSWATKYYVMGLFGEKYVPLNTLNGLAVNNFKQDKIAKLVIDSDERYILKTGATLELGEGYSLVVDQIDVDGNKAYIKFMKDGQEINSSIVTTGAASSSENSWVFSTTVLNEKDVQVMRLHVKSVFQGTQDSLVEIEGLWLMDYKNVRELKSGDKFGLLEYDGAGEFSGEEISLNADDDKVIANNMSIRVADGGDRFYFYVAAVVGEGDGPTQPDVPDVPTTPDVPDVPTTPDTPKPDVPETPDTPDPEKTFWQKYMWHIIIAIVLIIIIAGAAYYFLVMKKQ